MKATQILAPLLLVQPAPRGVKMSLGRAYLRLAACRYYLGGQTPAQVEELYGKSRKLFESILAEEPRNVDALVVIGVVANNLSLGWGDRKQSEKASQLLDESLGFYRRALTLAPDHPDALFQLSNGLRNQSWEFRRKGRFPEALQSLQEAVATATRLVAKNPHVPRYKQFLAMYHHQLGGLHESNTTEEDRFVKAARAYDQAAQLFGQLEAQDRTSPMYPRERVKALIALAEAEQKRGRPDVAREAFDRAIQAAAPAADAMPENVDLVYYAARSNYLRGQMDADDKKPAKALPYLRAAANLWQTRLLRLKLPNRSGYLDEYLQVLDAGRSAAAANEEQDEAIRIAERALPVGPELVGRSHKQRWCALLNNLAELYFKAGKTDEAIATLEKSVATAKRLFAKAPWHWYLRDSLANAYRQLADIYQAKGNVKEEILMRRQFLTLNEPLDDRDYSSFTAASNPLTLAEARRLRSVRTPPTISGSPSR